MLQVIAATLRLVNPSRRNTLWPPTAPRGVWGSPQPPQPTASSSKAVIFIIHFDNQSCFHLQGTTNPFPKWLRPQAPKNSRSWGGRVWGRQSAKPWVEQDSGCSGGFRELSEGAKTSANALIGSSPPLGAWGVPVGAPHQHPLSPQPSGAVGSGHHGWKGMGSQALRICRKAPDTGESTQHRAGSALLSPSDGPWRGGCSARWVLELFCP